MSLPDSDCVTLLQWASPRLGLRWAGFRRVRRQVCKRIARRMAALGVEDAAQYRVCLEQSPEEWQELDAACRVTISRFYRDRAVFDALRFRYLPALAAAAIEHHRPLRAWSAGCCSGEEPYSLALVLQLAIGPMFPGLAFDILATEADAALLERAREARYPPGALVDLPAEWRGRAFETDCGAQRLREEFRQGIRWSREDLRKTLPDGPFDVLLCRNMAFSYFEPALQQRVGAALIARIRSGGLLVIGAHEHLPVGLRGLIPMPECPAIFQRSESLA